MTYIAIEAVILGMIIAGFLFAVLVWASRQGRIRPFPTGKSALAQGIALVLGYVFIVGNAVVISNVTHASATTTALVALPFLAVYVCLLMYLGVRSQIQRDG